MSGSAHALGLAAAARAIREGTLSSEDYTRGLLERIAASDANVLAWAHLDPAAALGTARTIDRERAAGVVDGLLAGIGIGVKDIVATANQPTQLGSPIYAGARPPFDAECVVRLDRAGAFALGKTVTTEFAFLHPGKTRNPWSAAHTPGGSSSGSAAAVALGQVPAAIGTQTNGSMLRPAAYCGVVGFKPTLDALPFDGVNRFSRTLDTLGVFARSVDDCALLASCLADPGRIAAATAASVAPRIAFLAAFPWVGTGAEQARAMGVAAAALAEAGARLEEVSLPEAWRDAHRCLRTIMLHEGAQELASLQQHERRRMSAKLNAALDEGRAITDQAYRAALAERGRMIEEAPAWVAAFDAVVSPPTPDTAPADLTQTGDPACCTLWSLLGAPTISLPIALAGNGLPLGLQLSALPGDDDRLLAVARWCEERLPFRGLV